MGQTLKKIKLVIILFLSALTLMAQEKVTISGVITDRISSESLIGVSIYIKEINSGTVTNEYGFYSLTLPKGNYNLKIGYLGYVSQDTLIQLEESAKRNFSLLSNSQSLVEVVVNGDKNIAEIRRPEMSINKLSVKEIKQMPVVLGEVDVLKSILQLPGVTNAGEGQSGFNVRGGSADQNLVLLDEATIYNSSHLFGFFSIFNADAINDIKLYKGGIPARFGGRLSSVLDIYQKEGNKNDLNFSGGIGLVSSRLMVEGPVDKGKGSFLLAGRGSYGHLFLKLTDIQSSAYFYDLNTKVSYKINPKNNLYLSGYFGRDAFNLNKDFVNVYGNSVINARWNKLFTDKLFSNLSVIYSDYYYGLETALADFKWDSSVKNLNLKYDFKHYFNNNLKLTYGLNAQYYDFNPGTVSPTTSTSQINKEQLARKYALEPAVYMDVEQNLTKKLTVNYGLRYSLFYRLGQQEVFTYANNQALNFNNELKIYEKATPTGSKNYKRNETIASFDNLEPRIGLSYALDDNIAIKASYNRMSQYLHLLTNTQSPTPLDIWAPSDQFLKPQTLNQYAIGYFQNFKQDDYSLEIESFYKNINNRVDYIDGTELIANEAIEQVVLNGIGRAYGLELMLRKNVGRLTGWLSYTLSRSEQQTPGRNLTETGINNGQWYKSAADKLHNVSITTSFKWSERWRIGSIFALQSGQPVTFPQGKYQYQGIEVPNFGLRNQDNLPLYHHLDVSGTYTPKRNKQRGWQGEWVFSIYNIYNRQNAANISFVQNLETGKNEAKRLSIFGAVPSVTYNFKF
ncbi:MAG: TonB-dependent receptor [Daejeonella sp.]|uniref:TonB-dependent receptor n=1 Tax=Daejeonella sp. TaxID=2805397 RepID=UPI0027360406|nr:TonB-dependent receptor [Daejeonella sp.]MDP3468839.1 TonB-dependent receptor [Daejeonella sp.]